MSIAVITGASSGLGTCYVDAVTKLFPEIEELWLIARREDRLKEVAAKYPDKRCTVIPMDLANMNSYAAFAEKLQRENPQIRVLINDAGIAGGTPFSEMELSQMLKIIDLNCKGTTAITKVCLPYIVDGGTILEVSSTSAFVPNTNLIVYCASKSYMSAFCLGLREEFLWSAKRLRFLQKRFMVWNMPPCAGQVISAQRIPASAAGCARGIVPFPPSKSERKSPSGSKINASCAFAACTIAPNLRFSMANAQSGTDNIRIPLQGKPISSNLLFRIKTGL